MIVLDEQLKNANVAEEIRRWYRGGVINITSLRPHTVIKDDAVPLLLGQLAAPIFVTINTNDFWEVIAAERRYCILCFPLPDDRVNEISLLLRRLFRFPEFKTKQARCGKVALVSHAHVHYYQVGTHQATTLTWSNK